MLFRLTDLDTPDPKADAGKIWLRAPREYKFNSARYTRDIDTGVEIFVNTGEVVVARLAPELSNRQLRLSTDESGLFAPGVHKVKLFLEYDGFDEVKIQEGEPVFICTSYLASSVVPTETARFPTDFGLAAALKDALDSHTGGENA